MFPAIEDPNIFEDCVRNIARNLWPSAQYSGASVVGGQERDGIFETEECIHLLEATADRKKDKAEYDANKLIELYKKKKSSQKDKAILCWLVTRHEPTADQRDAVYKISKKNSIKINILSFHNFQSKIINAECYISSRNAYKFGSVHDPRTDAFVNIDLAYVDMDIICLVDNKLWSVNEIGEHILKGGHVVLLGDYGSGKSMTMKEIFNGLRKKYLQSKISKFPIYINLRDHQGQKNPAEILERHARNIGFSPENHLTRAWRAGYVDILLDGFDEITASGVQGRWRKLREMRYISMEAVRNFVSETPVGAGLIISGRLHYFDNEAERSRALGLKDDYITLSLNDFSESQIASYILKNKIQAVVPKWMPSRPLLIGTLLLKGVLQDIIKKQDDINSYSDPGEGWNRLIEEICKREARIEAGIDPETIRHFFERLATKARQSLDGLGPLGTVDIIDAFVSVCGYHPDEKSLVLVQRLPGLGVDSNVEDSRKFIDSDFADACRAGDVISFINDPFNFKVELFKDAACSADRTCLALISHLMGGSKKFTEKKINACLDVAAKNDNIDLLLSDITRIAMEQDFSITNNLHINGVIMPDLIIDFSTVDYGKVTFRDCYFKYMSILQDADNRYIPKFEDCYVEKIDGRVSIDDLPDGIFNKNCIFGSFVSTVETTDDILNLEIDTAIKVGISVMKKIYFQRGHGRLESALYRGLDANSRRYVADVLRILQREGLVAIYQRKGAKIWQPIKTHFTRVGKILSAPTKSTDPLLGMFKSI